eukprot:scaffold227790_cov28-Tisochrysis_lutea.AAC.2
MPSTKQIESRTLDLPEPFSPVIALNCASNPEITVRVAYDLNPSRMISMICMPALGAMGERRQERVSRAEGGP